VNILKPAKMGAQPLNPISLRPAGFVIYAGTGKSPLPSNVYKQLVRKRMSQGRWHHHWVFKR
jgi:hypothetical protein